MKNTIKVEEIFLISSLAFLVFALLIRKKTTSVINPAPVNINPKPVVNQPTPSKNPAPVIINPKPAVNQPTPPLAPDEAVKAANARPWTYDHYD